MFRKLLFLPAFFLLMTNVHAQDTLVLINGRIIPVLSVDLQEYRIAYRKIPKEPKIKKVELQEVTSEKKKSRLRTMDPERVFSIKYKDGSEKIIYRPDSLDPLEFTQEQMRLFIIGEQDATKYYKNHLNKGIGFGLGAGAGFLGFYGIAIPPLYATIMGSFTPNLTHRLKRQNELVTTKQLLDKLTLPVPPPQNNSSTELVNAYEESLKEYTKAQKNYESAVKKHSKNMSFSNPDLVANNEYREGYEKKARDRKIRNAMLSGLAGFIGLVVALPIIY